MCSLGSPEHSVTTSTFVASEAQSPRPAPGGVRAGALSPYLDMTGVGVGQGRQDEASPETYPLGRHAGPRGMPVASPRELLPHPTIWGHNTSPSQLSVATHSPPSAAWPSLSLPQPEVTLSMPPSASHCLGFPVQSGRGSGLQKASMAQGTWEHSSQAACI